MSKRKRTSNKEIIERIKDVEKLAEVGAIQKLGDTYKEIPGYEDYYEISREGCVRSIDRSVRAFESGTRPVRATVLRPFIKRKSPYYQLRKEGTKKMFSLQKLLRMTYGE